MSKLSKLSFLFAGLSLICLLVARMVLGGWIHALWVPLGLFLLFLIFPLVKDGRFFVEFFTMKTTKRGLNMGTMILLVTAVLVVVNVIAVRKYKTWDFSASKANTLSEQSIALVKSLDDDLKVTFFYKTGQEGMEENRRLFRELIKKYQDQTDRIRLDFVEVNERPDIAASYGVNKGSGQVFLEYKGRRNRIDKIDEQEFTSALIKTTQDKQKTVYYVTGHGEMDPDDAADAAGGNAYKMLLENNRYIFKTLSLGSAGKVPDDADMVAVVGPRTGFVERELTVLENYLKDGGSLLLALKSKQTGGLEKLLAKVGLVPENNYVLNVVFVPGQGTGVSNGPTEATQFSAMHPITKVFGRNDRVVMQLPMGLKQDKIPAGIEAEDIVRSPDGSMSFNDLQITREGPTGTYAFVSAIKGRWPGLDEKAKPFNLIVTGDSNFMANALLFQNLNRDLALNTVSFLAKEEGLISIAPRDPAITQMAFTDTRAFMYLWLFVIPLPLLMAAVAVGLGVRRRLA